MLGNDSGEMSPTMTSRRWSMPQQTPTQQMTGLQAQTGIGYSFQIHAHGCIKTGNQSSNTGTDNFLNSETGIQQHSQKRHMSQAANASSTQRETQRQVRMQ